MRTKQWIITLLCLMLTLTACNTGSADTTAAPDTAPQTETSAPETEAPVILPSVTETTLGEADIAYKKPAITNSADSGTNIYITDGDAETEYISRKGDSADNAAYPFEIVIDLRGEYKIKAVELMYSSTHPKGFPSGYDIEISSDGKEFTKVASVSDAVASDEGNRTDAGNVTASYVRIKTTKINDKTGSEYKFILSGVRVLSDITNLQNIVLNKGALDMYVGSADTLEAEYLISTEAGEKTEFFSSAPGIVKVNKDTGDVTAIAVGTADIYAHDGKNLTVCPVRVSAADTGFRISTFYLANHGLNDVSTFELLKESGIEFLENCRPYDKFGNNCQMSLVALSADHGLKVSVADPLYSKYLSMSDDEIKAVVEKYKNLPGYGGQYILDEPSNANPYARVYNAMLGEDRFTIPHLNLLPGGMSDFKGYITDWCATVGGTNMKYLSYDNYPFGTQKNTFNDYVYYSLDEIRTAGLRYDVDTAYYLQGMGIVGAYRVPTDSELLYNMSVGVAYGMKNFKWFVWFTPPYGGSGEHFITGVLNSDCGKSEIFNGVAAVNKKIKTLGTILSDCDAVEVYHTTKMNDRVLPDNFVFTPTSDKKAIFTLFVNENTGKQYVSVVNKNMKSASSITLQLGDIGALYNVTSGERKAVTVENGQFTLNINAGDLALIELPDGYDARTDKTEKTGNLALDCAVQVSSSSASQGHYAYCLTNGTRFDDCWQTADANGEVFVTVDMGKVRSFNRVDIYPLAGKYTVGTRFPADITVYVSDDNVNYAKVSEVKAFVADNDSIPSLKFDKASGRYVKLVLEGIKDIGGKAAEISEIEIYDDNGSVPPPQTRKIEAPAFDKDANLALGMNTVVCSSYEEYGWTQSALTNGKTTFVNGGEQGWCSMIGSQAANTEAWLVVELPGLFDISKVVVYSARENSAGTHYWVEVSADGVNWTVAAEVENAPKTMDARVMEFAPVKAAYVRFTGTGFTKSSIAAVGRVMQIIEIEVYQ